MSDYKQLNDKVKDKQDGNMESAREREGDNLDEVMDE